MRFEMCKTGEKLWSVGRLLEIPLNFYYCSIYSSLQSCIFWPYINIYRAFFSQLNIFVSSQLPYSFVQYHYVVHNSACIFSWIRKRSGHLPSCNTWHPKHVKMLLYIASCCNCTLHSKCKNVARYLTSVNTIYLNINQLDALNFIASLFHASTCSEHMCPSSGGQNCTIQSLVSSHWNKWVV